MKTVKIILLALVGSFIVSCESHTYEDISGEVANPTYTTSIKPIIDTNCLSCHSAFAGEFPTMETYVQVREAAENGNMICRIDDQSCGLVMPQSGRMPQTKINSIKNWVSNGFQQ